MSTAILAPFEAGSITIQPDILQVRDDLLAEAAMIAKVESEAANAMSVSTSQELRRLEAQIEESRVAVKRPALEFGRAVDAAAKEFVAPISEELNRQKRMRSAHQARMEAARREEERRQQEEFRRQQEEFQRQQAEARRQAEEARRREEGARAAAQAAWGAPPPEPEPEPVRPISEPPPPEPVPPQPPPAPTLARSAGEVVRKVWRFEVIDIDALASAKRDLVTIEPRRKDINAAIAAGMRECPGLRIWEEVESGVRR